MRCPDAKMSAGPAEGARPLAPSLPAQAIVCDNRDVRRRGPPRGQAQCAHRWIKNLKAHIRFPASPHCHSLSVHWLYVLRCMPLPELAGSMARALILPSLFYATARFCAHHSIRHARHPGPLFNDILNYAVVASATMGAGSRSPLTRGCSKSQGCLRPGLSPLPAPPVPVAFVFESRSPSAPLAMCLGAGHKLPWCQ